MATFPRAAVRASARATGGAERASGRHGESAKDDGRAGGVCEGAGGVVGGWVCFVFSDYCFLGGRGLRGGGLRKVLWEGEDGEGEKGRIREEI